MLQDIIQDHKWGLFEECAIDFACSFFAMLRAADYSAPRSIAGVIQHGIKYLTHKGASIQLSCVVSKPNSILNLCHSGRIDFDGDKSEPDGEIRDEVASAVAREIMRGIEDHDESKGVFHI